ncbi:Tubulin beta chain [Collichthys lucidus]|uniref:Tubulin beta chain n=1 Tax=Collichthys lucidus TaxID=240159 RepID=A0A4U5U9Y1_COLLU|nr:Tubulin beta chain [Collichthys lucidus]
MASTYHGDSDLQLERINVYYNEATVQPSTRLQTERNNRGSRKDGKALALFQASNGTKHP